MNDREKRQLENQLIVMGLPGLKDGNLVPEMAKLVPDDAVFLGMLNRCEPKQRREMYEAMRSHLKFEVKPLHWYEDRLKERASALASRETPITVGGKKYQQVNSQEATGCVITLKCRRCLGKAKSYMADTLVGAMIKARDEGWSREPGTQKMFCPKCTKKMAKQFGLVDRRAVSEMGHA